MSIPPSYDFPQPNNSIKDGDTQALYAYLEQQNRVLKRLYEDIAQGINGQIKSSASTNQRRWTPVLDGTSTSDTFTYDHQLCGGR